MRGKEVRECSVEEVKTYYGLKEFKDMCHVLGRMLSEAKAV